MGITKMAILWDKTYLRIQRLIHHKKVDKTSNDLPFSHSLLPILFTNFLSCSNNGKHSRPAVVIAFLTKVENIKRNMNNKYGGAILITMLIAETNSIIMIMILFIIIQIIMMTSSPSYKSILYWATANTSTIHHPNWRSITSKPSFTTSMQQKIVSTEITPQIPLLRVVSPPPLGNNAFMISKSLNVE